MSETLKTPAFLHGAAKIGSYLRSKGVNITDGGVYYAAKKKKLPIGKYGDELIASPEKLDRYLDEITD
jgi:hypothetical protein